MKLSQKLEESFNRVKEMCGFEPAPEVGLILGSGLGYLADEFEDKVIVPYSEIPHFLTSTAIGHAGNLVFGKYAGKNVVTMQGRFHAYEGYDLKETVYPIYFMKRLGVKGILLTNASGGVNTDYKAGDLVAIEDVINMAFKNPLIGSNDESVGVRFPDMSSVLDEEWFERVQKSLKEKGKELKRGTYVFCLGPSYETPAEIRAFRSLGGDLVGMSTVPEIIAARHSNMRIFGISCVTNMAAGVLPQKLTHHEVMETANRVKSTFAKVVQVVVENV